MTGIFGVRAAVAPPSSAPILAIDTALQRAVVALGRLDGTLLDEEAWVAGHRHGEELLIRVNALLARRRVKLGRLGGIVVGTGPGAFTGLRVGLATAKALAHGLGIPIVGVSTAAALLAGVDRATAAARAADLVLLLPAGPSDRVLVRGGHAHLLPAGAPTNVPDADLVAVDLPERAPGDAIARGGSAVARLGASLIAAGATRLRRGDHDDIARLVPEYVTLPRGVTEEHGEVEWSHGLR